MTGIGRYCTTLASFSLPRITSATPSKPVHVHRITQAAGGGGGGGRGKRKAKCKESATKVILRQKSPVEKRKHSPLSTPLSWSCCKFFKLQPSRTWRNSNSNNNNNTATAPSVATELLLLLRLQVLPASHVAAKLRLFTGLCRPLRRLLKTFSLPRCENGPSVVVFVVVCWGLVARRWGVGRPVTKQKRNPTP